MYSSKTTRMIHLIPCSMDSLIKGQVADSETKITISKTKLLVRQQWSSLTDRFSVADLFRDSETRNQTRLHNRLY